ncbi:MAG: prepilin-type N-terminal cleavage/methylation domain-containing protein [Gammaproteobacteria bacterium]
MIKKSQAGFSLLELAIAIVILAAILGSVMVPVATQVQARKIMETEQLLDDAKEALLGFALSNARLPCPDNPAISGITGIEDPPCAAGGVGFLPWSTLGVTPSDSWGHLLIYRVTSEFTNAPNPATPCPPPPPPPPPPTGDLDLCDGGDITIITRGDLPGGPTNTKDPVPLTPPPPPPRAAPAVIVSVGPNGSGGTDLLGNILPAPAGADEQNNLNNDLQFVTRPLVSNAPGTCSDTTEGQPLCNFDDLVVWLSTPILFNRMVAAGRLP